MNSGIHFLTYSINTNFENMIVTSAGKCVINQRLPRPAGGREGSLTNFWESVGRLCAKEL